MRIIEMPEDNAREALRDPRAEFCCRCTVSAIKKGETLVKTGGGKTTACAVCHGPDLEGTWTRAGIGRPLAELQRPPDVRYANRCAEWVMVGILMKPVVAKLTEEDLVNISAYTASLAP